MQCCFWNGQEREFLWTTHHKKNVGLYSISETRNKTELLVAERYAGYFKWTIPDAKVE